jgi:hypothetical protein
MPTENRISISQWIFLVSLCIGGSVLWTAFAGKDLNWDSRNYHFYVAYQWLDDRLSRDFLASGVQSYFNPLAYLPFYWMVRTHMHSLVIGAVLATIHSVNLLIIAAISDALLPRAVKSRFVWILMSVALAAFSSVYALEAGNTFIDAITSIFVLAGYLVSLRWMAASEAFIPNDKENIRKDLLYWAIGGLLLGVACGLKLTNALYAVALIPLVASRTSPMKRCVYRASVYSIAGITGFTLTGGYWAWRLFSEFGNPIFPLANAYFKSPDFPATDLVDTRFIPDTVTEAWLLPLQAMVPDSNIYAEWCAPESKFLLMFIFLAALAIKTVGRRYIGTLKQNAGNEWRAQTWLVAIWLFSYVLWLYGSGNGRYFIVGLLLLGPMIVTLLLRLFGVHRVAAYVATLLLILQVGLVSASGQRWTPAPWTSEWFEVRPSETLINEPYLYLTPTVQTSMYLAPFLHRESTFANIGGQMAISPGGPGGQRVESMINRYGGQVRSLFETKTFDKNNKAFLEATAKLFDGVYERFGLETDINTCEVIEVLDYKRVPANFFDRKPRIIPTRSEYFAPGAISCKLVPRTRPGMLGTELAHRVDRVFNRIEEACPKRFSPSGVVTNKYPNTWGRSYFNSAVALQYLEAEDKLEYRILGGGTVNLGHMADWEKEHLPLFDCSVKKGHRLE